MKLFVYISALIALVTCGCRPSASTAAPSVQKWEYKVVQVENFEHYMLDYSTRELVTNAPDAKLHANNAMEDAGEFHIGVEDAARLGWDPKYAVDLSALGRDGWELVSTTPLTETVKSDSLTNTRTGSMILIFKRPAR